MTFDPNAVLTTRKPSKTERLMARAMVAAWQAPMFGVVIEADMHAGLAKRGAGVTVTDVIVQVRARTLIRFPQPERAFSR